MKLKKLLFIAECVLIPHIMIIVGICLISTNNPTKVKLGVNMCKLSGAVIIVGSIIYYIFFTPILGVM